MNNVRARAFISVSGLGFAFALIVCLGIFTSVPLPAAGPGRAECRSVPSKILGYPVGYCVVLPSNYDTDKTAIYPVLYFLHGIGDNEQSLIKSGIMNLIQDLRDQQKIGEFLVATPDGDRTFYINSRDGEVRYEDFVIREFIPYIESHYRIRAERKSRGITGISMGGYGALRFGLLYPNLFIAASAHSAALIEKLPPEFDSQTDTAFWQRESPFTIVRKRPRPVGLQIYFDCGTDDDYGFNHGAQQFHDLLDAKGIPNEFHLYPGAHDWPYFAEHLPASLEFQSRAFGLTPARGK
ncbi:MAG: alpha/beta hydrolase-fold protein [Candidatus Acidiferrales bacterium]